MRGGQAPSNPSRRALFRGMREATQRPDWVSRLRREMQGWVHTDGEAMRRDRPLVMAAPQSRVDLRIALEVARDADVPVVMRGGGSSWFSSAAAHGLLIDQAAHLQSVEELDTVRRLVWVEPGVVPDRLNAALRAHGLEFPIHAVAPHRSTIGGLTGRDACGLRGHANGSMMACVQAIDAVLDDGVAARFERFGDGQPMALDSRRLADLVSRLHQVAHAARPDLVARWPRLTGRVGGYPLQVFFPTASAQTGAIRPVNLAQLLVGSEGSLATFERIQLRLSTIPPHTRMAVVRLPGLIQAVSLAPLVAGLRPAALVLVDCPLLSFALGRAPACPLGQDTGAALLVEFTADEPDAVQACLQALTGLAEVHRLSGRVTEVGTQEQQSAVWQDLEACLDPHTSPCAEVRLGRALGDFSVPLDQLADCTEALGETFSRMGLKVTWTAKATPGTMHLRLFLPPQDGGVQTDGSLVQAVMDHVLGCQGAFSGECPAGAGTRDWLTRQFGDRLIQAMVAVKQAFDPRNRLSPGKIIGPD